MPTNRDEIIRKLRESDEFGLLNVNLHSVPQTQKMSSLLISFEEIVDFFEENKRLPKCNPNVLKEFQLYHRYKSICRDRAKLNALETFDIHKILVDESSKELSIDLLREEDVFNLLDNYETDIFNISHVAEHVPPAYIARRKFCHNFVEYEQRFKQINEDLKCRRRKLVKYDPILLKPGEFFVLNGVILFLETVDGDYSNFNYDSGSRNRFDGRTNIIFDNGTTSDMLFRSLDKALQKDGYAISETLERENDDVNISSDDCQNGYIYILRTKHCELSKYQNLYKIGCTTTSVYDRIRNAKNEPTYLFSEVEIVSSLRCYNIEPEILEDKIHRFFNLQRLDIQIFDKDNNLYRPREWFIVNLQAIKEAIHLILNNEETKFMYDPHIGKIIKL